MNDVLYQNFMKKGPVDNLFTKYKNYSQLVRMKKDEKINQHFQQSIILSFLFKL